MHGATLSCMVRILHSLFFFFFDRPFLVYLIAKEKDLHSLLKFVDEFYIYIFWIMLWLRSAIDLNLCWVGFTIQHIRTECAGWLRRG